MGCNMQDKKNSLESREIVHQKQSEKDPNDDPYDIPYHNKMESGIHETVMQLQEHIRMLQEENDVLEQQNKTLEIDNVCLSQQKKHLENRIDDLVNTYPSASILLGKTPDSSQEQGTRLKKRFFKGKKK